MAEVSVRELRNNGAAVLDRVVAGERLTVTRAGRAIAVLSRLERAPVPVRTLVDRWRKLPELDPESLRRDLDRLLDAGL